MRTVNKTISVKECLLVLLCLSVVMMSGCGSSGVKRADKAVDSVDTLKVKYGELKTQIDATIAALDGVSAAQSGDLNKAFKAYGTQVKKLDSKAKEIVSLSADLRKRSKVYIDKWEKDMAKVQSPALREAAAERRAQATAKFEQARDELERIRQDYEKFSIDLSDIKVALENDLNRPGVMAIGNAIAQTKKDAGPVKADIDAIIDALNKISVALSAS